MQPMDPDASDCMTAMSINQYPSWEGKAHKEGTLRRIAHTDFEVITLLFQRSGLSLAIEPLISFLPGTDVWYASTAAEIDLRLFYVSFPASDNTTRKERKMYAFLPLPPFVYDFQRRS